MHPLRARYTTATPSHHRYAPATDTLRYRYAPAMVPLHTRYVCSGLFLSLKFSDDQQLDEDPTSGRHSSKAMAKSHGKPTVYSNHDRQPHYDDAIPERQNLLEKHSGRPVKPSILRFNTWTPREITVTLISGLIGIFTGAIAWANLTPYLVTPFHSATPRGEGGLLKSNGTEIFGPTVLMISIDGFRTGYLDPKLTPNLLEISKRGSATIPNHWSILTGLHAESHGIIANDFWDPISEEWFNRNNERVYSTSRWWLGEPMWETAKRAGLRTANLMWPGPNETMTGISTDYTQPWSPGFTLNEKLDQLIRWIDLPFSERPQLILAYEDSLDQIGHRYGPLSAQVNATLQSVDRFVKNLFTQLEARHLTEIIDVVIKT
ncbi:hypothetical protein NP233_g12225 [Leucocoprinus birnbaumii]|uniref:Uncharacterized protein n=1 Tax=Leucocoprinus birnbaumii TaxID=56174 RepID=A0AAD5VFH9_9AGAR|nr:hypothetical protein NP233_g12225 [Leucocoprinus birnbaumii]